MIFFASQRGRSAELANHLMNGEQNEHVTIHDIRGFVADNIADALKEAYAMSRGTRCKQFLFSVSLNPPETADVAVEDFEAAIEAIEQKMGLLNQPRVVVFHEKNGRRHCHAVWSRIDTEKLVAVHLAHFKIKLMEISRLLFLKHGWKMPKGMQKGQSKHPFNLTRQEYRQAVRLSEDPQALKAMFKTAWEQSDSKETFIRALEEQGFLLARGDRRGFVAIDIKGGVYSLSRWIDIGTRDLKARLGLPETLPDIGQAKAFLSSRMTENLNRFIAEARTQAKEVRLPLVQELRTLTAQHRKERADLLETQQIRWVQETRTRAQRLSRGMAGVWQRVTGEYQKIRLLSEAEARTGHERDSKELHALVRSQLQERQELQKTVVFYKEEYKQEALRWRRELAQYVTTATEPPLPVARAESAATAEKMPLAAQLAAVESKIALLSGDIATLQSLLENNLLSDEMRGVIRRMIEKTLETLHIRAVEAKTQEETAREKTRAYQEKQAEFNEYIRRYAELQLRLEQENRKIAANKSFHAVVMDMSYSLNGIPRWQISVMMPPPGKRLDERAFTTTLQQYDNRELLKTAFKAWIRPPVDPPSSVPNLRASVLEVTEVLARAGLRPSGGGKSRVAPVLPRKATVKFNAVKR